MSYEEACQEFISVVKNYEGTLDYREDSIVFYADNLLTGYYEDGSIWKQKTVRCEIGVTENLDRIFLFGHEATYQIVGGFALDYNKETLLDELKQLNFKKKDYQYSIFDL